MTKIRTLFIASTLSALLLIHSAAQCQEGTFDFRISGVMRLGAQNYKALVEFANGEKTTVAAGDNLQSWKVLSISDSCMTLTQDGKSREECLAGSNEAQPSTATTTTTTKPAALKKPDNALSHFKQVDKDDLLLALDGLARSNSMAQLSETILPLAGMPPDQQINQIDAQNVSSVKDAVDLMHKALEANRPVRLSLTDQDNRMNVIYLQSTPFPATK